MPIFEFLCLDCGNTCEMLITSSEDTAQCRECNSKNLKKLLSATSSMTGSSHAGLPGPGDTACCGSSPGHAGCAGPGSCCGKAVA